MDVQSNKGLNYTLEKPIEETIIYDKPTPQIARLTFNRPEKHNAWFFPDMDTRLRELVRKAVDDDEVKVIIMRGNGPSFCSGDDLNRVPAEAFGMKQGEKLDQMHRLRGFRDIYDSTWREIMYCPKNVISSVRGWAMGVGFVLAEISDLVIAGESAKFSHAEQRIGFGGMMYMMTMLTVGPKRAREIVLRGETVSAAQALDWGMINSVVPDDQLDAETLRWAEMICLNSADGLMNSKVLMQSIYEIMGLGAAQNSTMVAHTLFTNLSWHPGEMNFLKLRNQVGTGNAAKQREERWAQLGF